MRPLPLRRRPVTVFGSLVLLVSAVTVGVHAQGREVPPASKVVATLAPSATSARESLAGTWVYNAEESLNAANGRKEDAAALRRAGNAGTSSIARGGGGGGRTGSGGGTGSNTGGSGNAPVQGGASGGGYGGYGGGSAFTPLIANERRDLVRDLLEIPVELKISLTEATVTFIDHLDRTLTYPTDSKKQKYQLSASVFEAKAYWDGTHFKKEIAGSEGFKMSETYMLSENGQRLFVIVRLGDPQQKDAPLVGANRIYDRAQR